MIEIKILCTFRSKQDYWLVKRVLYKSKIKRIYLPELRSNCISSQYLLGIALQNFSLPSNQITVGSLQNNLTKTQLFFTLYKIADIQKVYLEFNTRYLPKKEWLINVIHTLDSQNDIFKDPQYVLLMKEELKLLQDLQRSLGKLSIVECSHQQKSSKNKSRFKKLQHRVVQQENQLDLMNFEQKELIWKSFEIKEEIRKIKAS